MTAPLRNVSERRAEAVARARPAGATRPELTVVPGRRRVAWFAVTTTVLVSAVLMGVVLLHTRIAERQLEIDRLSRSISSAQEAFDVLRAQRAELRSPTRLADEAGAVGMRPGAESTFVAVDPMVLAIAIAQTGRTPLDDEPGGDARLEPLDQFRLVKSVNAEAP